MIKAFPKIFAIGTDYIRNIFDNDVEITEKIDGSQFAFGKINDQLHMRSKGVVQYAENPDKMFVPAIEYVQTIESLLPDNIIFYCEFLGKRKHNILQYDRIPRNYLMLFGISQVKEGGRFCSAYSLLQDWACKLNIEAVPIVYYGRIDSLSSVNALHSFLNTESGLGCTKVEGVVVKNYSLPFLLGNVPIPIMMGKYVSEKFKEVHLKSWKGTYTSKGRWEDFKESFRTEARWNKAIQHLREKGLLANDPKDIGKLIKEIQSDISSEEEERIKKFLFEHFGKDLMRNSVRGFPEYYKEYLLTRSFDEQM